MPPNPLVHFLETIFTQWAKISISGQGVTIPVLGGWLPMLLAALSPFFVKEAQMLDRCGYVRTTRRRLLRLMMPRIW
jgi:hypothetical protein